MNSPVLTPVAQAAHSILAPSSAARRRQCPQSTTLEAMFPETEQTPDAADGVAAHWAVAEQLSGRLVDAGVVAPNGVVLTAEMARAADMVYDDVCRELAPYGLKPGDGHVETQIRIPRVHPQSFGTPDYFVWVRLPNGRLLLFVYDFKYGHLFVEVFENPQLIEYIAGICEGVNDLSPGVDIVAKIVQPRCYHREGSIRAWRTTLADLRAHINISSTAAHEALGANPRARVGPECRDCRARHACPALQKESYAAMHEASHVSPLVLPPSAASVELHFVRQALATLKARESGLEAQLTSEIRAGKPVPGWTIQHGEGRRRWTSPDAHVIAIAAALNVNVAKPPEALTPKQAAEAGLDPGIVDAMSSRIPGAATLVQDDGTLGRRLFG